jgi:hypothetical protein
MAHLLVPTRAIASADVARCVQPYAGVQERVNEYLQGCNRDTSATMASDRHLAELADLQQRARNAHIEAASADHAPATGANQSRLIAGLYLGSGEVLFREQEIQGIHGASLAHPPETPDLPPARRSNGNVRRQCVKSTLFLRRRNGRDTAVTHIVLASSRRIAALQPMQGETRGGP